MRSAPAGEPLEISVLGELTATRAGVALDLGGRRQRAVLGLLVLARGDVVPADRLIDSLWGDQPPAAAVGALQSYVSHLRRRLEPASTARSRGSVIVSKGPGYALTVGPDAVDAWRFERLLRDARGDAGALVEALGLWRGPALAEYTDEPWAQAEVARLTELREVAKEQLVAARLTRGEAAVVVPEAEALVSEAPLREERWRLLALALYRARRQGDALAALRRARQTLSDELGIDPGPALRELEAEVLAQSPSLEATSARVPSLIPTPATTMTQRRPDDLVDRGRELAELTTCLADAFHGEARLVLIEGPAGIGKTRLLAETRRLVAERGGRICAARGSQLEKEYGFGAVRQLFEPLVAARSGGPDPLAGAAAPAASVFDLATAGPHQRGESNLAVLHGLYWLVANLAGDGPVLLAVDDLQWCDSASLRFLAYLVRRIEALPVLIVATLRTGEEYEDEAVLAELTHDPITVSIAPAPLSLSGVGDLVRARLGDDAEESFVAACHRTTSGNPLLVRQLLRALQSEGVRPDAAHADTVTAIGSRAISSLVLMRLSRLPQASTDVARAIAVLGNGATLPTVATLAGLTEVEAARTVAVLARAEVLRDEYPLGFVHPLVADAVYRDLPPGERQLHHDRAARVLRAGGAAPEQIAAHLLQAPHRGDPWVVEVLSQAAARANDRAAPGAASAYLVRALQEPPEPAARAEVLLALGRAEAVSNAPRAVNHLKEAYEAVTDPPQRAVVAQMLTRALVFAGAPGEATAFGRRAALELTPDLDDERQGLLGLERIAGYMHDVDEADWRHGTEPAVRGRGPGARMLASALAWETAIDGTDRTKATELARFAVADGLLTQVDIGLLWAVAGVVLTLADEDTGSLWDEGMAVAQQRGAVFGMLTTHLWRGFWDWRRGNLREAYQQFRFVSEQSDAWGVSFGNGYSDAYAINVLIDLGDIAAARSFVERIRGLDRFAEATRLFAEAQATVLLAEGRYAEAIAHVDEVRTVMAPGGRNPAWRPWRSLRAQALAGLGRHDEAIAQVEDELTLARKWGAPSVVGRTLRLLGELRGADGVGELREAVGLLAPSTARLEHARALYALARHLPPAQARSMLTESAELAWHCEASALYRDAVAALVATGVAAPAEPPAATRLTAMEREMAIRYVGGATERDIAQALFLTPQTVRSTLDEVGRRLGASTADEMRRALARGLM